MEISMNALKIIRIEIKEKIFFSKKKVGKYLD